MTERYGKTGELSSAPPLGEGSGTPAADQCIGRERRLRRKSVPVAGEGVDPADAAAGDDAFPGDPEEAVRVHPLFNDIQRIAQQQPRPGGCDEIGGAGFGDEIRDILGPDRMDLTAERDEDPFLVDPVRSNPGLAQASRT